MNMEHDMIMEEKVEQLSERLEQLVLDAFIAVLVSLNERSKLILKSVNDEDIQFWSYDYPVKQSQDILGRKPDKGLWEVTVLGCQALL